MVSSVIIRESDITALVRWSLTFEGLLSRPFSFESLAYLLYPSSSLISLPFIRCCCCGRHLFSPCSRSPDVENGDHWCLRHQGAALITYHLP